MPAGFSHLRVQLGQLLLIQVVLLVNTGLVSELRPWGGWAVRVTGETKDSESGVWTSSEPGKSVQGQDEK